jgi:hypothetical protein
MKRLTLLLLLAVPWGACTDADVTDVDLSTLSLTIVGDPHRTGTAGQELAEPVTVYLEKMDGKKVVPANKVTVNFVVTEGGGKVFAGAGVTDESGLASDYWTLGPTPGSNTLEVRAVTGDGTKHVYGTFTATGLAPLGVGFGPEQWSLIPAGTFQMGDMVGSGTTDELPVHPVNITRPFYMQKTEVTQGQWKAVMGTRPSYFSDCGDTCPVENVDWNDIQAFLAELNAQDPGKNYRLPTEAEWEYAARAGTTGDYGGTGILDDMGWYADNSSGITHPVARKLPNAWGVYDIHGNVGEWVRDWWSSTYYQYCVDNGIVDDPQGPDTGMSRVLRGGRINSAANHTRSAYRSGYYPHPSWRTNDTGFRLIWSEWAPPPPMWELTVSVDGTGTGTVTSEPAGIHCGTDCSEQYPQGTLVTLTATPEVGSTFSGWGGDCQGSDPTCVLEMSEARSVTGFFSSALPAYTIDWANLQWPGTTSASRSPVDPTEPIFGRVWIDGVTDNPGATPGLIAQVGYGNDGTPPTDASWRWFDASFNKDEDNGDEFVGTLIPDSTTGTYHYLYRYSTNGGESWVYGAFDNTFYANLHSYDPDKAGRLTITD